MKRCLCCGFEMKEEKFSEIVFKAGKRASENAQGNNISMEPVIDEWFVWN